MFRRRPAAAVAVLATATSILAAAPALAADRTATTLGIREAKSTILPGGHNRISGQLRARGDGPLAAAAVTLLRRPEGAARWHVVRQDQTNANGVASFSVSPRRTTRYELRYAGDDTHRAVTSGVVRTVVRHRLPTAIGVRVATQSLAVGESTTVHGRLHLARSTGDPAPLPGRTLTLRSHAPGEDTWTDVASATTDSHGAVSFTVTPASTTRYALFFTGGPRMQPSRSRGVTVFVGDPTALSISTTGSSVNPGQSTEIDGVLTSNGTALSGQTVQLRARPRASDAFSTVATRVTGTDGTVAFTVSPAGDTAYRLRFAPTTGYAGAVSPTQLVLVRRPTSLSIRLADGRVGGTLRAARTLAHRLVTLQSRPAGSSDWTDVASKRTGRHGWAGFAVAPAAPTDYRLVFAQTARFQGCASGIVTAG